MASEEKTSAADIPLKSHQEVTSTADIPLKSHQEVTSAADIPLKSHEELEPWTMPSVPQMMVRRGGGGRDFHAESDAESDAELEPWMMPSVPQLMVRRGGGGRDFHAESDAESDSEVERWGTSSTDQQIMDRSHEVSLDIDKIATSLSKHLNTKKVFSQASCIYRVPARLRELNEKAYTPRVVSIGPLHHDNENLEAMEDHKIMYLQQFIEQSKVSVGDLINVFKGYETKLRDCYAETIYLKRKDFAIMILLDAVFIIMVLLKFNNVGKSRKSGSGDQIFSPPFKFVDVVFDMCLLENQLPFFFLEILLELYPTKYTIKELTFKLLKKMWPNWVKEDSTGKINSRVLHFVDFLRKCQQPTEQHLSTEKTSFSSAPTAMKLHQSGVKFKNPEKNPERKSLFDIRFRHGTLEIPQLIIDDHTEILFRNLQAFEQCHHKLEDKFVSDYIAFISFLVRAPNDVEVLADNENLKNMLNNVEAVSNLVYNLDKENVVSEKSILGGICDKLTEHCKKRRHKWMANLKQVYFNNPWTAISVVAATFLLVLTATQTVCSILQL